jgi:hypothetical protein
MFRHIVCHPQAIQVFQDTIEITRYNCWAYAQQLYLVISIVS